jgi:hypothetical protein
MWGTFILDSFRRKEAAELRDALEELLGPISGSAWSSGGVYVLWNPETREPLYIGITGDLPVRFAQHTGLRVGPMGGCKRQEIESYFADGHERLGYTIATMSSLSQVRTARHRQVLGPMRRDLIELSEAISEEAMGEIRGLEGRLIAYNRVRFGGLPRWNNDPGRIPKNAPAADDGSLAIAVGAVDILLQARRTIRQLAADPLAAMFEEQLHGARMVAVAQGIRGSNGVRNDTIRERIEQHPTMFPEIREELLTCGYLDQRCPLTTGPIADPPL